MENFPANFPIKRSRKKNAVHRAAVRERFAHMPRVFVCVLVCVGVESYKQGGVTPVRRGRPASKSLICCGAMFPSC